MLLGGRRALEGCRERLLAKGAAAIAFLQANAQGRSMIDMNKINKLMDIIRRKDWVAAHAMLDEEERLDPDEGTVAHWRSVVLRNEGRYEDALRYLADNLSRFNCKTGVFDKRARIFHQIGNDAAAMNELALAPFDSEIDEHWALVMDAKFFRLYLMVQLGLPIADAQWTEIPDDYISVLPTGEQISKKQLMVERPR